VSPAHFTSSPPRLGGLALALLLLGCSEPPPALETTVGSGAGAPFTAAGDPPAVPATDAPRVIAFDPPQGASGVDPARTTLAVTFDRSMDREGWAWVVESPETAPEIGDSSWDATLRVNTAQVRLEPGRSYVIWINSATFSYFRDPSGTPAQPVRWAFSTAAAPGAGGATAPFGMVRAHEPAVQPPRVVSLAPPAGARDVDAANTPELRVVFDRPMGEGWSWVMESEESFPPMAGKAYQSSDGLAAALPVRLEPGRSYVVWLNSKQYDGFHDSSGTPLPPVRWEFTTAGGPPAASPPGR
jgi:hypothetical protein